ncbi:MAG: tetratricopeptide repeat protein [Sphingobacteriia bacterium]|nr:tetratricopeptide repeat protein [Sphingobacteriia bacterium]
MNFFKLYIINPASVVSRHWFTWEIFKQKFFIFARGFFFLPFILIIFLTYSGSNTLFALGKKQKPAIQNFDDDWKVEFDSLFALGINVLYTDPDSSRNFALQAISLAKDQNSSEHIRALNLLGASYNVQSNFTKALDVYQEALEIAVNIKDTTRIASIYNNVGIANMKMGNYNEALDYLLKSMSYYDKINQDLLRSRTISNIGLLYMEINNYEKAKTHFQQALEGYKKHSDSVAIANAYTNTGILFAKTGQTDSAFIYLDKAIDLNYRIKNQYGLCVVFAGKANVFNEIGEAANAIDYYTKSLDVAEELNHYFQKTIALQGLASAYLAYNEPAMSIAFAQKAMEIARLEGNEKLITDLHKTLSEIYEATGDYDNAFKHYKSYIEKEKELINQTKLHQIYNLEIDYLNQTKAIQQLKIQQQNLLISKKNNIIFFIIIAFLLIFAGVYLLYLNHNHRREAAHQKDILNLTEKKSRAAIEAELQERSRIGRELHDGLGQMLSAVRLNISAIQQKSTLSDSRKKELIDFAIESVDKAFNELREISHNLAQSALAEKGLTGALKELANQVNQSKHMQMKFEAYGVNGTLDNLVENTLYRAAQELLTNAIKHANATTFSVQLIKSNSEITLMVEDNGKGFNADLTLILPGGGLNNIRSRVENLNGQVFIDTMENRGSIVTIVIPIKNEQHTRKTD